MRVSSLLFLFLIVGSFGVRAAPKPAEKLVVQIEQKKQQIVESEEQQREIMSSLFEINKKMKNLVSERAKSDQDRMQIESSTRTLAARILELETKIKDQKTLLQVRLNAIYKLGGQGLARLLFSSMNSAELERNLKILGLVAKRDVALMKDYSKSVAELGQKQKKFLNRLAALKKTQKVVQEKEKRIVHESQAKARFLDSIRKRKTKTLAQLRTLREKGQALGLDGEDELLDLLLQPSFFEKKGNLPSPVGGTLVRRFGLWKDPDYNVTLNQKGLLYQTRSGSDVSAVFPGKIAFKGQLDGFGPTLILDHGDHYYSVYGGLQQINVQEGVDVKEGQKIASASSGVYFEIRHFSEPYDPMQWMKGQSP